MTSIGRRVSRLSGYAPALPTPFREDGSIDFAAFESFCELQIHEGASALVVCGTTGEAPTLSPQEQRDLVRMAAGVARGRVPVIAGAGSNSTAHAIELVRQAEAARADAILSVVPYYNKPTQAGLYQHFRAVVAVTGLPVILYDVPPRTACALADETVARLAEDTQFIGLKDATGDLVRRARLSAMVGADFRLLSGDDATAPAFIAQGGHGCISVASNLVPGLCRTLFLALRQGHAAPAQHLARPVALLSAALFRETSPGPLKHALSLLGFMSGRLRLPLVPPGESVQAEIAALLALLLRDHGEYIIGKDAILKRNIGNAAMA